MPKTLPHWLITLVCCLAAGAWHSEARADACTKAAQAHLGTMCGAYPGATLTPDLSKLGSTPPAEDAKPKACPAGKGQTGKNLSVAFQKLSKEQLGDHKQDVIAPPQVRGWQSATAGAACPDLAYAVFASDGAGSEDASHDKTSTSVDKPTAAYTAVHPTAAGPAGAVRAIKDYRSTISAAGGVAGPVPGTGTGFEDVATEAVQILGQIVADRASSQAYVLLKTKLADLLGCQTDLSSTLGFNQTCSVLMPLRLQDLATSRDALVAALVKDIWLQLMKGRQASPAINLLRGALEASIVPLVTRPSLATDSSAVRAVLSAILSHASQLNEAELTKPEQQG